MADENCTKCGGCGEVVETLVEYDNEGGQIWYSQSVPCDQC